LRVRRSQPHAAPAAVHQLPLLHGSLAAATSCSEQPGGGALPGARPGLPGGLPLGGARSAFAPYCAKRAAPEGALLLSQGKYS
jgi:hypothetical protein